MKDIVCFYATNSLLNIITENKNKHPILRVFVINHFINYLFQILYNFFNNFIYLYNHSLIIYITSLYLLSILHHIIFNIYNMIKHNILHKFLLIKPYYPKHTIYSHS